MGIHRYPYKISANMNQGGFAVEVTGLSPKATEGDVYDFFSFSGSIESVEIARYRNFDQSTVL